MELRKRKPSPATMAGEAGAADAGAELPTPTQPLRKSARAPAARWQEQEPPFAASGSASLASTAAGAAAAAAAVAPGPGAPAPPPPPTTPALVRSPSQPQPPPPGDALRDAAALRAAVAHVRSRDARLAAHIDSLGGVLPERLLAKTGGAFSALARAIVYQQLSTKAADTIHQRVLAACGRGGELAPPAVLSADEAAMRAAGLSASKAAYLRHLAEAFSRGGHLAGADGGAGGGVAALSDAECVAALTRVKGVGVWSAHMFQMFHLGRPDILPVGDLGVRRGMQVLYGLRALPGPAEMEAVSDAWRPFRSVGSWFMWRVDAPRRAAGGSGAGGGRGKKAAKAPVAR